MSYHIYTEFQNAGLLDGVCEASACLNKRLIDNIKEALAAMDKNTVDKRAAKKTIIASLVDEGMNDDRLVSKVAEKLGVHRNTVNDAIQHRVSLMSVGEEPINWVKLSR
jgi:predicted transcriptional regulator YheO